MLLEASVFSGAKIYGIFGIARGFDEWYETRVR